jgi:hypothetical protein
LATVVACWAVVRPIVGIGRRPLRGSRGTAQIIATGTLGFGLAIPGPCQGLIGQLAGMGRRSEGFDFLVMGQHILGGRQRPTGLTLKLRGLIARAHLVAGIDLALGFGDGGLRLGLLPGIGAAG